MPSPTYLATLAASLHGHQANFFILMTVVAVALLVLFAMEPRTYARARTPRVSASEPARKNLR